MWGWNEHSTQVCSRAKRSVLRHRGVWGWNEHSTQTRPPSHNRLTHAQREARPRFTFVPEAEPEPPLAPPAPAPPPSPLTVSDCFAPDFFDLDKRFRSFSSVLVMVPQNKREKNDSRGGGGGWGGIEVAGGTRSVPRPPRLKTSLTSTAKHATAITKRVQSLQLHAALPEFSPQATNTLSCRQVGGIPQASMTKVQSMRLPAAPSDSEVSPPPLPLPPPPSPPSPPAGVTPAGM